MHTWEIVVWWLLGGLLVLPLALRVFGHLFWVARFQISRATDTLAQRFPSTVRDWSPTVVYLVMVGTFALILHFPTWAPWGYIADPAHADNVMPLPLLGAAAGLIALLTFAASHLKDIDKSAQAGDIYLGRNLATYVPIRSWWIRVLPRPFFAVITLALFIIPPVLSALPQTVDSTAAQYLPWAHFSVHQLATALWVACFTVAAAVLLLNLFSVLGNAPNVALRPNSIRRRIERDLQRRTGQEFAHLKSLRPSDQRPDAELWAMRHLRTMARLPATEQETYLRRTLVSISTFDAEEAERVRLIRSARRLAKLDGVSQRADAENTHAVSAWIRAKRHAALRRDLGREERINVGVISAILSALASDDISAGARGTLKAKCLRVAEATDRLYAELVRIQQERHPMGSADEIKLIASEIMLAKPSDVDAHLDGHLYMRARLETDEPRVLKVAGLVFKRLAPLVFDSDPKDEVDSPTLRRTNELIDSANLLAHAATSEFALRAVASAAVRFATASVSSASDAVQKALKWRVEIPGRSWSATTRDLPKSRAVRVIESATVSRLISGDTPSAEQITRLLPLIDGWRVPASFLHRIYYGRRSHNPLTPDQQHAFSSALRQMSELEDDEQFSPDLIVSFLTISGSIGHFVVGDGVRWLLKARGKTLTLELCADFMRRANNRLFPEFYFADFLVWHMLSARRPLYAERFGSSSTEESEEVAKSLWGERRNIQLLANEWSQLDEFTASRMYSLLQAIPDV